MFMWPENELSLTPKANDKREEWRRPIVEGVVYCIQHVTGQMFRPGTH